MFDIYEELRKISVLYNIEYDRVLELYNNRCLFKSNKEYVICCKIQALMAREFLLKECNEDTSEYKDTSKMKGFVMTFPKSSGKVVIK